MMNCEINTDTQSSQIRASVGKITILVVDDDSTCLSIVAAILKTWKYEVVTVKHALDALFTLRIKGDLFDLVVSDVHMPGMNGFELQKKIDEEFSLPVVLMSADDKEGVILKGLENGAAFFLVKPISPDDLKNLWQYAVAKKNGKGSVIKEATSVQGPFQADNKPSIEEVESASSVNGEGHGKKDSRRKVSRKNSDEKGGENNDSATPKKVKVVWTSALHNQFLEAIRSIGLERAVPKKILELMNVPGLTRENVASHLQKYRIFLKRVSDASYNIQSAAERNLVSRSYGSATVPGQSTLMFNGCSYGTEQQQLSTFQRRVGKHVPVDKAPGLGPASFHDQEVSSGNYTTPPKYGQSRLLCDQGNLKQSIIGNHFFGFTVEPNKYQTGLPIRGGISGSSIGAANSMQVYQQKAPLKGFNGPSKCSPATFGFHSPNYRGQMGTSSSSSLSSSLKYSNNNYAGLWITGEGVRFGSGHVANLGVVPSDTDSNHGLMNRFQNSGNTASCLVQGAASSSAGFASMTINQFSPTFTAVDPQENTLVPQQPPTISQQQKIPQDERGYDEYMFELMNNSSAFDNNSLPIDEADFSSTFLDLDQGWEEIPNSGHLFCSYDVQNYPSGNDQILEQQHDSEEVFDANFITSGHQSEDYFPWFDQHPKQQKGCGEFVDTEDHMPYLSNTSISVNYASPHQLDDEKFIDSVFSTGAFGGL